MEQRQQQLSELLESLSPIEAEWMDEHAQLVISALGGIETRQAYRAEDLKPLLAANFEVGMTVIRLFLGLSSDEFTMALRSIFPPRKGGQTAFNKDPDAFLGKLEPLKLYDAMAAIVLKPTTWADILQERLRSGRGKAIKGHARGRSLEDFTEAIVQRVFGEKKYDVRVRFTGADGQEAKTPADFAIPSKKNPLILIESKAYGATGSKQTDLLTTADRIVAAKRNDTTFLVVTDGETWILRQNDLRELALRQQRGEIARIYTIKMAEQLEADLRELAGQYHLPVMPPPECPNSPPPVS